MAATLRRLRITQSAKGSLSIQCTVGPSHWQWWRQFQSSTQSSKVTDFAFAFDIDGVLVRSSTPLPGASKTLSYLQKQRIPFILLTNGGGKSEEERVADLQEKLGVPLDASMIVLSHTPFADMVELHKKTVLVMGGDYDKCQKVAMKYGFQNAVTPGDIVVAYPDIWPFSKVFLDYYRAFAKSLPKPINPSNPTDGLRFDAVFVYSDPRDWGLDSAILLDVLLSRAGIVGTISSKNGDKCLTNKGYQQDGQPPLYYSNPDLWWAAKYHSPRLGQGGFQAAFEGLWATVTGGAALEKTIIGKPHQLTYEFAERRLRAHRKQLFGHIGLNNPLRRVYMIGDNPESDIKGANTYQSPHESAWTSILVESGVYQGGEPSEKPTVTVQGVEEAVKWALRDSGYTSTIR